MKKMTIYLDEWYEEHLLPKLEELLDRYEVSYLISEVEE